MAKIFNRVAVAIATTGTGTVTLGSAIDTDMLTPAEAGAVDTDTPWYLLEEGGDFEIGQGTVGGSVTTLARTTVIVSKISGTAGTSKMNLQGGATLRFVEPSAAWLAENIPVSPSVAGETDVQGALGVLAGALFSNIKLTSLTVGSGTFTPDADAKGTLVFLTGGGGGGGGAAATDSDSTAAGGGGSNGETRLIYYNAAEMGANAAYTIGASGAAGASSGGNGGQGGASTFNPAGTGDTVTANPGEGGPGVSSTQYTTSNPGAAGTAGSNGILISPSVAGKGGYTSGVFTTGTNRGIGGDGSSSFWASGGHGSVQSNSSGAGGAGTRGSGGGGAASINNAGNVAGGAGGNGFGLIIEFLGP